VLNTKIEDGLLHWLLSILLPVHPQNVLTLFHICILDCRLEIAERVFIIPGAKHLVWLLIW